MASTSSSDVDLDAWLSQIKQCHPLSEPQMRTLCSIVKSQLLEESNIQPVSGPVTVVGDIHGQFWDVLELFRIGGECPATSYVFMVSELYSLLHSYRGPGLIMKHALHRLSRVTLSIEAITRLKLSPSYWF